MPTRREVIDRIRRAIAPLYEPREAEQIARRFTFERCGITLTQYVVAPEAQADIPDLEESVRQLAAVPKPRSWSQPPRPELSPEPQRSTWEPEAAASP